ncbi:MAG TPA: polar amino acid ABC transporter ATP-binding protein, partial [Syntrophomonas wolfei]|nr:polar amino acid ABC transporter ATP-binding protein [Syntrophomonas wolfei]
CLNHLERIDSGRIEIEGETIAQNNSEGQAVYSSEAKITQARRKMGMVFQNFNLFPHKSVMENLIMAPTRVKNMDKAEAEESARLLLAKVGLSQKADNYPFELSGGQQ